MLVGLSAVLAAIGLLAVPSQVFAMDEAANVIVLLIGLAVGVDYSLFYLKREREERAAGKGKEAALEAAAATSGRAILISGLTVIAALAGMFFGGSQLWTSIAIGAILVVAIAVAGSLTVLPALLGWLGDRVEKGRIPLLSRRRQNRDSRIWGAVLDRVLHDRALGGARGRAAPAPRRARALHEDGGRRHQGVPQVARSRAVIRPHPGGVPGGTLPAVVAIQAEDVAAPAVQKAIGRLREEAIATGSWPTRSRSETSRTERRAGVDPLTGGAVPTRRRFARSTRSATRSFRAPSGRFRVEAAVTRPEAVSQDFSALMDQRMPIAMGFVLVLAFALLLVAFRSVVIAAKAIVLNLLSVAAAFGLLVAVFQWGWGEELLGFESTGAIIPGLPLFMFVVLFGLSMDYHVFILTRVRESYDRGLSNADAVAHGIRSSAAVVTAAAFVMVAVFSIFLTLSTVSAKQFGFGLAAAILIDATIVRAVLLPATMKLFGDWNWYLPSWLQWLPRLEHERSTELPGDSTRGRTQGWTGSIPIAVPTSSGDPCRMSEFATDAPEPKHLQRSRSDRMLAGVSGGLARYFEIHPAVFRVGFVVLTLLGGAGILIYLAAALVMPDEGKEDSIATAALRDRRDRPWPLIGLGLARGRQGRSSSHRITLCPTATPGVLLLVAGVVILWITRYRGG